MPGEAIPGHSDKATTDYIHLKHAADMHYQNPPVKPSEPPRTLAVELQAHSIESSSGASVGRHGTIAEASLSKEIDTCEKEGRRV